MFHRVRLGLSTRHRPERNGTAGWIVKILRVLMVYGSLLLAFVCTPLARGQSPGRLPELWGRANPVMPFSVSLWVFQQTWRCVPGVMPLAPWPSVVIVPSNPGKLSRYDHERELADWLRRLPQVPPPDEIELLRPKAVLAVPPRVLRGPLLAPEPEAHPEDRSRREVEAGKAAFLAARPGEAAEHFRRAIQAVPHRAEAYFLLAQAEVARGRYRDAVKALDDGLRQRPDWPAANFRPVELYGKQVADFVHDLSQLERAVQRSPDEPGLRFLLGYQWWFTGRRAEARSQFQRAAELAVDPKPIRLFLDWPD